jgi:hypothetical protein
MAGPTGAQLREYERCVAGMFADPDLHGDLLLIGLAVAHRLIALGDRDGYPLSELAAAVFAPPPSERNSYQLARTREAFRRDIRRYDAHVDAGDDVECKGPMIRRTTPCGARSQMRSLSTDLQTGRRFWLAACSRHSDWYDTAHADDRAAVKAMGDRMPRPPANTGGVLARHLTGLDWPAWWSKLDPEWTAPPEETPFARPALRVLITDDVEPTPAARPALRGIDGGMASTGPKRSPRRPTPPRGRPA